MTLAVAAVLVAASASALGIRSLPSVFHAPRTETAAPARPDPSPAAASRRAPVDAIEHPPPAGDDDHRPPPPAAGRAARGSPGPGAASDLSVQVAAYERAVALLGSQPGDALVALQEYRARWPGSPLCHEVDLRIVQTLVSLGRSKDAQAEARRFLVRYPNSPRRADMEALAGDRADSVPSQ
jgi:TolA-binding protein